MVDTHYSIVGKYMYMYSLKTNEVIGKKKFNVSKKKIYKKLKSNKFEPHKTKDIVVENKNFPFFNLIFYGLLYERGNIPTFDLFSKTYLEQYDIPDKYIKGLLGRLSRAYPAYIREVQVLCHLRKMGYTVNYDSYHDISGIDLTVSFSETNDIGLRLISGSPRSWKYCNIKEDQRHDYNNQLVITYGMQAHIPKGGVLVHNSWDLRQIERLFEQ